MLVLIALLYNITELDTIYVDQAESLLSGAAYTAVLEDAEYLANSTTALTSSFTRSEATQNQRPRLAQGVDQFGRSGGSVSGTVRDGRGTPIEDVEVFAGFLPPRPATGFRDSDLAIGTTDSEGRYAVLGLKKEIEFLTFFHPAYAAGCVDLKAISGSIEDADATLRSALTVKGSVRMGDQIPPPSTAVILECYTPMKHLFLVLGGPTSDDGTYSISKVPPGNVTLITAPVWPDEHSIFRALEKSFRLDIDQLERIVDLHFLSATSSVSGQVFVDGRAAWLGGSVYFRVVDLSGGEIITTSVDIDSTGHFESPMFPPGQATLRLSSFFSDRTESTAIEFVQLKPDRTFFKEVLIESGRGRVQGAVTGFKDADECKVDLVPAELWEPSFDKKAIEEIGSLSVRALIINDDGSFALTRLKTGTYIAVLQETIVDHNYSPGFNIIALKIDVDDDQETLLEFDLEEAVFVRAPMSIVE